MAQVGIKYRHFVLIGIFLSSILFIVGCSSNNRTAPIDYKTGISELYITDNSLFPSRVSNMDLFSARVIIQNKAAYPLTDVQVGIAGLDRDKIMLDQYEQKVDNLDGRSLTYPEGDRREVIFNGKVEALKLAGDDGRKDAYQVYVSYASIVELSEDVCVSGASMMLADGGCSPTDYPQSISGQGAPLAITEIYNSAIGTTGKIRFTLKNRGRGDAIYAGIEEATLGGIPIQCEFLAPYSSRFEFESKKSVDVSCSFKLQEGSKSYLSPVYVKIRYGYRLWDEKSIIIQRAGAVSAPIDDIFLDRS